MKGYNKTGEYPLALECIEAIVGYFDSSFSLGFNDCNVWRALATDGVPDPETPEEAYKVDSADLVIVIHYLIDHRRRLLDVLGHFKEALEDGDDILAYGLLLAEVIDAALENRPGPFDRSEKENT